MGFTYGNNPQGNAIDAVRLLTGDTVTPGDLSDEEIAYFLVQEISVGGAALAAARVMYSRFSRQVDKTVGDLRISLGQKAARWRDVIEQLKNLASSTAPLDVWAGGQSQAEEDADETDTDLVQPRFEIGMHGLQPLRPDQLRDDV